MSNIQQDEEKKESFVTRAINKSNKFLGTFTFLMINVILFIAWIISNSGIIPFLPVFDPFPFDFLTSFVSLEAIILSVFVLIAQNKSAEISDIRAEIDLKINEFAEKEITKILEITKLIAEKNNIDLSKDKELSKMLKPLPEKKIQKIIEEQIKNS